MTTRFFPKINPSNPPPSSLLRRGGRERKLNMDAEWDKAEAEWVKADAENLKKFHEKDCPECRWEGGVIKGRLPQFD